MSQMEFPNSPVDGDEIEQPNGNIYKWDALKTRWRAIKIEESDVVIVGVNDFIPSTLLHTDPLDLAVVAIAPNIVVHENQGQVLHLVAQIRPNQGGTFRLDYSLYGVTNPNVYGQVHVNDIPYGPLNSAPAYITNSYSEEVTINAGDSIQIYAYSEFFDGTTGGHVTNTSLYTDFESAYFTQHFSHI